LPSLTIIVARIHTYFFIHVSFLRATAATAIARLSHRLGVCRSVCPPVRHTGESVKKRCEVGSPNLHRRLPLRL